MKHFNEPDFSDEEFPKISDKVHRLKHDKKEMFGMCKAVEDYAKEYILENLRQTVNTKNVLIENVRTFEEDTGLELDLDNYLTAYNLSLYEFYHNIGSRSMFRLKKWAGLISDKRDADDQIYRVITGLFHINSARLLDYWIRYIQGDHQPVNRMEILMRNMLYYSFFRKHPQKRKIKKI